MKRKAIALLLCLFSLMTQTLSAHADAIDPNVLTADSATLIDGDTGQILFSKNPDKIQFPASTTKALTALIIAEDLKMDEVVTIDAQTPFTTGSRIYVIEGETFTVEQLLHAMLLESANDAAVALAKYHSGTVEQFAVKMNARAKALGATNSNFVNPNGLPDEKHTTTAHDLALIGQAFTKQPKLMEIVKTYKYDIPATNKQPEARHIFNSNRFLSGTGSKNKIQYKGQTIEIKWDAVTGLKTGYTNAAQQCFIVSATQNGRNLIAVVLKAKGNGLYIEPRTMLEYGFNSLKPFQFATSGQLIQSIELEGEKKAKIDLYTQADVKALIPLAADEKNVSHEVVVNPNLKLPITENQVLGKLKISYEGQILTETNLVSLSAIGAAATLGKDTVRTIDWLPIDQSPTGLTILGLRIVGALVLWQLILRAIGGKKKKKPSQKKRKLKQNPQGPTVRTNQQTTNVRTNPQTTHVRANQQTTHVRVNPQTTHVRSNQQTPNIRSNPQEMPSRTNPQRQGIRPEQRHYGTRPNAPQTGGRPGSSPQSGSRKIR